MAKTIPHLHEAIYEHLRVDPNALCLSLPSRHRKADHVEHEDVTCGALLEKTAQYTTLLRQKDIGCGDKVIVLAPLSSDTVAIMLAIMALGGVVVLIDVSMKFSHVLAAIRESDAKAIVTTTFFRLVLGFLPAAAKLKKIVIRRKPLENIKKKNGQNREWELAQRQDNDPALITFTSGTTARPKAVNRTHGILGHQRLAITNNHPTHQGALIHCFPVLILYHLSVGTHSVLAHSSARPMASLPEVTFEQIRRYQADALIAAPTFLQQFMSWAETQPDKTRLAQLQFVGCGGAPIPFRLLELVNRLCPAACAWVVFGSTEAEPIAHCTFAEAIRHGTEAGLPVGSIVSELKYAIVNLTELDNITEQSIQDATCEVGEVGELIISGKHVVEEYLQNQEANQKSKIRTAEGQLWHRCGDLAYQNSEGEVFIVGRKGDEITQGTCTIFPFQIEYQVDTLFNIKRSCLVQKHGHLTLIIEKHEQQKDVDLEQIRSLLEKLGVNETNLKIIESMPLDKRHNSKINRANLRRRL